MSTQPLPNPTHPAQHVPTCVRGVCYPRETRTDPRFVNMKLSCQSCATLRCTLIYRPRRVWWSWRSWSILGSSTSSAVPPSAEHQSAADGNVATDGSAEGAAGVKRRNGRLSSCKMAMAAMAAQGRGTGPAGPSTGQPTAINRVNPPATPESETAPRAWSVLLKPRRNKLRLRQRSNYESNSSLSSKAAPYLQVKCPEFPNARRTQRWLQLS